MTDRYRGKILNISVLKVICTCILYVIFHFYTHSILRKNTKLHLFHLESKENLHMNISEYKCLCSKYHNLWSHLICKINVRK